MRFRILTILIFVSSVTASGNNITGPSSSASPYVVRVEPGVVIESILTVGDSVNDKTDGSPYRLVGIPDGLGAYDNGDGTFTVLVNHELRVGTGVERAHGATGAFISRWTIRKADLTVLHGEDLTRTAAWAMADVSSWTAKRWVWKAALSRTLSTERAGSCRRLASQALKT